MIEILCIRHGQAAASWQENPDPGLSEEGTRQALGLVPVLRQEKIRSIISSPMQRTRQTASPLCKALHLPVTIDNNFCEIPTPALVPLEKRLDWLRASSHLKWPQLEEGLHRWRDNILNSIRAIQTPTIIVTHFMVLNVVVGSIRGDVKLVNYRPDYCSVLRLGLTEQQIVLLDLGSQAQSRLL
ncbi:histidine phosphatase family protein [Ketobacter sp. MCCC 1A13808]|uniref:histidine phosphatase family protein n=1 Tax=Ketobacter sp. MCCC 1A13808 TaxID=2602738 RepID=UPI0012EC3A9C|nr:histidine phosphatase family protein [Ketobacter sp. MCCC 1A13808]MVF12901.1 histidine phosphatase family protein [Ketobacter sp. MCCC 1A13808]